MNFYVNARYTGQYQDGGCETPFTTLEQAFAAAENCSESVRVIIREGTCFVQDSIRITRSELTVCAFGEEEVILTGAKPYRGLTWQPCPEMPGVVKTQIERGLSADQLFIDGKQLVMARYPDYLEGVLPLGGVVSEAEIRERSRNWKNPASGFIRALHSSGWGGNDYYITGRDESAPSGLSLEWTGDNNRGSGYMAEAMVAENIPEELDAPGEWYYDKESGSLYCYPDQDVTLTEDTLIEIAVNSELFRIQGQDAAHPVKDIRWHGITFSNTSRTMFTTHGKGMEYVPLMRGDWAVVKSGVITVENSESCIIEHCRFQNIGGNALFFYGYHADGRVDDNEFINTGSSCIQMTGNPCATDQPSFWPHDYYPENQVHANTVLNPCQVGPVTEDYPRDMVISNNHMENIGVFEKQSAGVNLSVSSRIRILHNTIHKSARSNINVNDGTFGGHEIAYNDLFDSQRETMDHGPFNSWGRDRFWSVPEYQGGGENGEVMRSYSNDGKNFYDITMIDAYQTSLIHNNRFHHEQGAPHTWGIDLDDGSSNYEIYENLCLGLGVKLREGFQRKVYNNVIINGKMEIHVPYQQARDQIYGNLIINHTPWSYIAADEERVRRTEDEIRSNWYYYYGTRVSLPEFYSLGASDGSLDRDSIEQDPVFTSPGQNNYTVNNLAGMELTGFHNFDLDAFGKPGCIAVPPVYDISKVMQAAELKLKEEWKGALITAIDDAIISATGSFGYEGVYFDEVPEQSEAYAMGFRKRDIVKGLSDLSVDNAAAFRGVMATFEKGEECEAAIHRTNHLQTIRLKME